MEALKTTRAKIALALATVLALFKFVSEFKIPRERLEYTLAAASALWLELLVCLLLFVLFAFHRPLRENVERLAARWKQFALHGSGRTAKLAVLLFVLACIVAIIRLPSIYSQLLVLVDSRSQVYSYAFGGRYSDFLRERALAQLDRGLLESADATFARAERWTFSSPTRLRALKDYRSLIAARTNLADSLLTSHLRNNRARLSYASSGALAAAYVLNSEGDDYRAMLQSQFKKLDRFAQAAPALLAGCGARVSRENEARFGAQCLMFAGEAFDSRIGTCSELAEVFCERLDLLERSSEDRAEIARDLVERHSGADELAAILGRKPG